MRKKNPKNMRIIAEIIEFQKKNATFRIFFCTFAPNS